MPTAAPGRRPAGLPGALLLVCACAVAFAEQQPPESDPERPQVGRMGESVRVDPEDYDFSRAETLLWMSDHLANVQEPLRLRYRFSKRGVMEEHFDDRVLLDIRKLREDGTKDTSLEFFSGTRAQQGEFNDNIRGVRGNPVLGIYLQGDAYDMHRLTDGNWRYFQKMIKLALAGTAETESIEVPLDGHSVAAELVRIYPYADDENHHPELGEFSEKYYEFVFSDAVPGSLYRIRTVVPGPDGGEPLIEEILSYGGREEL